MKRAITSILALGLVLGLGAAASAQDDAPAAPKGEKAFQAMDTNGDGKISKEEFLNAAKKRAEMRFIKLDANSDGSLTKDELAQAKGKRRAPKAAAPAPAQQ